MNKLQILLLVGAILLGQACNSSKKVTEIPEIEIVDEVFDTVFVTAPKATTETFELDIFNPSADRTIDLLHMDLEVSFNWEKEQVLGLAKIKLRPYFYTTNTIELDAKTLDVNSIKLNGKNLNYKNTGSKLEIELDRLYQSDEEILLVISYDAYPTRGQVEGASDDQGLYFINSSGTDPDKPTQLWSQGETENNSRWFPTVDKPNERYTHNISLVVQDKYETLSNGYLQSSESIGNGLRKDIWVMDKPHAPYLTMIAVGDYAIVKDKWGNTPLMYYVYKNYKEDAKDIFNHTPEMLSFFGDYVGVAYPWDQYAQIVVTDFVAGAMENTTAVTFGEFVQLHKEDLIDRNNDNIVAHEMFHHWFGDYVTCESWANLTLNEGFANYSEYLWTQHKYGQQAADVKRFQEFQGYLDQANFEGVHPLINYSYTNKENMFDTHSYNKGGLVLHMLRDKIGEDAFRKSLNHYLSTHAYSEVEADELRIAFEDVTGLDLKKFFDQWYFSAGHPILEINYKKEDGAISIEIEQIQSAEASIPIFELPLVWEVHYDDGSKERFYLNMNQRKQSETFDLSKKITWINFDPDHVLLAVSQENKTSKDLRLELLESNSAYDQLQAITAVELGKLPTEVYLSALNNAKHDEVGALIADQITYNAETKKQLDKILVDLPNSQTSFVLMQKMLQNPSLVDFDDLEEVLASTSSPRNKSILVTLMAFNSPNRIVDVVKNLPPSLSENMVAANTSILSELGDESDMDYMIDQWQQHKGYILGFISEMMLKLAISDNSEQRLKRLETEVYSQLKHQTRKEMYLAGALQLVERLDNEIGKTALKTHLTNLKSKEMDVDIVDEMNNIIKLLN